MSDVERVSVAAMRRRQHWLRSWLKHERQTLRMVLAETFRHSSAPFPPKFKVEWVGRHEQHAALRGQKTMEEATSQLLASMSPLGVVPAGLGDGVGHCHDVANLPRVCLFISLVYLFGGTSYTLFSRVCFFVFFYYR